MSVPRETMPAKVQRLLDAKGIEELESRSFLVPGDHGDYVVTIAHKGKQVYRTCQCAHGRQDKPQGVCTHIQAASRTLLRERLPEDPFDGIGPNH